jgi:hypothetical protein
VNILACLTYLVLSLPSPAIGLRLAELAKRHPESLTNVFVAALALVVAFAVPVLVYSQPEYKEPNTSQTTPQLAVTPAPFIASCSEDENRLVGCDKRAGADRRIHDHCG